MDLTVLLNVNNVFSVITLTKYEHCAVKRDWIDTRC